MATVDCRYLLDPKSLSGSDYGSIDRTEWKIVIASDELGDSHQVGRMKWLDYELGRRQITQQTHLGLPAKAGAKQIGDLGED